MWILTQGRRKVWHVCSWSILFFSGVTHDKCIVKTSLPHIAEILCQFNFKSSPVSAIFFQRLVLCYTGKENQSMSLLSQNMERTAFRFKETSWTWLQLLWSFSLLIKLPVIWFVTGSLKYVKLKRLKKSHQSAHWLLVSVALLITLKVQTQQTESKELPGTKADWDVTSSKSDTCTHCKTMASS